MKYLFSFRNSKDIPRNIFFCFLPLFFFLLIPFVALAQVEVYIAIKGTVERYGEKLGGANVVLYKNSQVEKKIITGTNGKFKFDLTEAGKEYVIEVSKPNHVTVRLGVSTKLPEKFKEDVGGEFTIRMEIFEKFAGLNTAILNKPIAIIKYLEKENRFDYDHNYFNSIKNQLSQLNNDVEDKREQGAKPVMDGFDPEEEKAKSEAARLAMAVKKAGQEAEAKALAELKAKEAQDELALAEKKAREGADAKALAEMKAKEAADAIELKEKWKAEQAAETSQSKKNDNSDNSMETEAIRLAKEKQAKEAMQKQNSNVKKEYENELLKIVAENERKNKELNLARMKSQAEANAAIERMKQETSVKSLNTPLLVETQKQEAKSVYGRQVKTMQVKSLIETVAYVEKSTKVSNTGKYETTPRVSEKVFAPVIKEVTTEEDYKTVLTTTVSYLDRIDVYKKEKYWWRTEEHYKNDESIDAKSYEEEMAKLKKSNEN